MIYVVLCPRYGRLNFLLRDLTMSLYKVKLVIKKKLYIYLTKEKQSETGIPDVNNGGYESCSYSNLPGLGE